MKKINYFICLSFIVFLTSCSSIKYYTYYDPIDSGTYKVSIGNKVFSTSSSQDLPNIFGKADIFGGKIKTGYSYLIYLGINNDNIPMFNYYSVQYESTETTMSRYGSTRATVDTHFNGNTTTSNITISTPPEGTTYKLEPNSITFSVDVNKNRNFTFNNLLVEIVSYDSIDLVYKISKTTTRTKIE